MRKRTKEIARLAEEKGYRLQKKSPLSGDYWLWGRVYTHAPLVVGSLGRIEAFFAQDDEHQMEMEANASFAMRHGLTALAELRGPSAVAALSLPAKEAAALYDDQVKGLIVVDDRPWHVDDGSNTDDGFFVYGYRPSQAPVSEWEPALYGPYSTLEDATAVMAGRDPTVRHLSEELLARQRKEEDLPPPPPG